MRRYLHFPLALLLLVAVPSVAEAGIPIPCTGESIVKVLDIPVLAQVEVDAAGRRIEKRFDLGYKFSGCTGGEWVAYVGNDREYVSVSQARLQDMLRAAGRSELPPAPSFWSSSNSTPVYIWTAIIGFGILFSVFQKGAGAGSGPSGKSAETLADAEPSGSWAAAAARMDAGLREQDISVAAAPAPRAPAGREPAVSPRGHAGPQAGAPVFGRRH